MHAIYAAHKRAHAREQGGSRLLLVMLPLSSTSSQHTKESQPHKTKTSCNLEPRIEKSLAQQPPSKIKPTRNAPENQVVMPAAVDGCG